ncbi:MAG: hypothetical protein GX187_08820 [Clostridiaceae bacterium]|nr:hypothetical protein [Clostridiaceae bacterium]
MDDFNISPTYSTGWRRLKREDTESEMKRAVELGNSVETSGMSKQIYSKIASGRKKQGVTPEYARLFEENQKEIMDRIIQLQDEITSIKELLNDIQASTEIFKKIPQKNIVGSKLTKFFK